MRNDLTFDCLIVVCFGLRSDVDVVLSQYCLLVFVQSMLFLILSCSLSLLRLTILPATPTCLCCLRCEYPDGRILMIPNQMESGWAGRDAAVLFPNCVLRFAGAAPS